MPFAIQMHQVGFIDEPKLQEIDGRLRLIRNNLSAYPYIYDSFGPILSGLHLHVLLNRDCQGALPRMQTFC